MAGNWVPPEAGKTLGTIGKPWAAVYAGAYYDSAGGELPSASDVSCMSDIADGLDNIWNRLNDIADTLAQRKAEVAHNGD